MRNTPLASIIEPLEPRRLFAAGGLDTSFGNGGKALSSVRVDPSDDLLVTVQPDGGIIVTGIGVIARFTAAGQPDLKFGIDGQVADPALDRPAMIAAQPDGKTLVGAYMTINENPAPGEASTIFLITRYHASGKIDKTFGHRGRVAIDNPVRGQLVVQPDGKILFDSATLRRLLPDGSIDTTFGGGDGLADGAGDFGAGHVGLTADGKIVAVGTTLTSRFFPGPDGDPFGNQGFSHDTTIVRFNDDGTLDTTFANAGKRYYDSEDESTPYPRLGSDVVIAPDGAIVSGIGGDYVRFAPAGELDTTFGGGDGILHVEDDDEPFGAYSGALALQSDGKVLITGGHATNPTSGPTSSQMVRRLNADGSIDTTFAGGKVIIDFGRAIEFADRVLLAPDGTILVAGAANNFNASPRLTLARLWRDNGPAAQAVAPAVLAEQSTPYRFRVNWRDDETVDFSSIDNGDLKAIGPDGSVRKAYIVGADATDDSPNFVMNFKIAAPGGAWDAADNGTWTIRVLSNHVADTDGNAMRGRILATFEVNIPAAQGRAASLGASRPQAPLHQMEGEDKDDDELVIT